MTENLLEVNHLKTYFFTRGGVVKAVDDISFNINRGETLGIVGESGCGKSVTALSVMRLVASPPGKIVGGEINFNGENILEKNREELTNLRGSSISMIFQDPMTSLNPVFTVGYQIAEVLRRHIGMTSAQARERAIELLDEVGIPDPQYKVNAFPSQMSGGQQQRVMIAMAIACEPKLLIADEPTTALDVTIQKQILDLIAGLQQKHHMSVLFITHDLGVVGDIADTVVVMQAGEIKEQGPVKAIFEHPQHPYTKALLACRPRLDARPRRLPVIDDFIKGDGHVRLEDRTRGTSPGDPI